MVWFTTKGAVRMFTVVKVSARTALSVYPLSQHMCLIHNTTNKQHSSTPAPQLGTRTPQQGRYRSVVHHDHPLSLLLLKNVGGTDPAREEGQARVLVRCCADHSYF